MIFCHHLLQAMIENNDGAIVLQTDNHGHLSVCSLVLSAADIPHMVSEQDGVFHLLVSAEHEEQARHQLESYTLENQNWPPEQSNRMEDDSTLQPPTIIVIGALILFYWVTGPWTEHSLWFQNGAGDGAAILKNGEYQRLVTALTLHADVTHLLGNCFLGGFLFHFLCKTTGSGLGFFAILFSATLGNFINVLVRSEAHLFVGYSTAVFATIGILAMISYHRNRKYTGYHLLMPIMAGAALLAMTGSSGERTDLGAHFFGLACGFVTGMVLNTASMRKLRASSRLQGSLLFLTAFIICLCWSIAMT